VVRYHTQWAKNEKKLCTKNILFFKIIGVVSKVDSTSENIWDFFLARYLLAKVAKRTRHFLEQLRAHSCVDISNSYDQNK